MNVIARRLGECLYAGERCWLCCTLLLVVRGMLPARLLSACRLLLLLGGMGAMGCYSTAVAPVEMEPTQPPLLQDARRDSSV